LNQVINKNKSSEFIQDLTRNFSLNTDIINLILKSKPNYNYLYSNYSEDYFEPLSVFQTDDNSLLTQSVLDTLYGSSLESINLNRFKNQVSNADWIRNQTCFNNIYLLKGNDKDYLKNYFCSNQLNDTQLAGLFVYLSKRIDFSQVKTIISNLVFDDDFFSQMVETSHAYNDIKEVNIYSLLLL